MKKLRIGFYEAYTYLKKIKEDINPNKGFIEKLKDYENEIIYPKF